MKLSIHAVGRMKAGPERDLAGRYIDRLAKAGPAIGLEFSGVTEQVESRASSSALRKAEEARKLLETVSPGAALILLDERGKNLSSQDFAARLGQLRDEGCPQAVLAIGGPDGHDESLQAKAGLVLSFGKLTWPHQIVRIMAAEQLYRAVTILSGHPYHRD